MRQPQTKPVAPKRPPKPSAKASGKRTPAPAERGGTDTPGSASASAWTGPRDAAQAGFPIVGIGASAGGLEALELFLRNVPPHSKAAFVIVQHRDPNRDGLLVELLQRATPMPVAHVEEGVRVQPERVYVLPPGKDLSIRERHLHLHPTPADRGLRLPIDMFLRSLAVDQRDHSIGVILSGMGADGTLGLRAIKETSGATFAQDPASARFDAMPRSAIDAGLVDVVAAAEELPAKIFSFLERAPQVRRSDDALEPVAQAGLDVILGLLRVQSGNDFSRYKRSTVLRRVERRMGLHQIEALGDYARYLRENPMEIDLLFRELLIGVTSFFRDPAAWDQLKREVLPTLLAACSASGVVRAWVPACSTGEEAYSLAIALKEATEPFKPFKNLSLQIFATDLDRNAIERARQGHYLDSIAADVSQERLRRYFVQDEHGYRVGKEIREMVVFATQNAVMDPPFTKLDMISCRNLLIYLSADLQKKLIPLLHYSLNPGGVLFLGSAETVGAFGSLFTPLDAKSRLYRKQAESMAAVPVEFPSAVTGSARRTSVVDADPIASGATAPANLQVLADRVLVQRFSPVGVLCNERGDVLYISGPAGKFLEPAVGKANLNVFAMAREGLRYDLSRAFGAALREGAVVARKGLAVRTGATAVQVDLMVQKLADPKELRGTVMVVLAEATRRTAPLKTTVQRRGAGQPAAAELEEELDRTREEIQTIREEMQTSQEELTSTNEELQSTNEELQSTNEELTTSKEEMQSLNEELQTVNAELQAKVEELSRSNNDMKNLLNSTDIATLFLDGELRVRRFTTPTARIIKLIPVDAGRPITDIVSDLDYPDLADDAREVLRTLVFVEKHVSTKDGRWFAVRIMPYRTLDNVIDGLVITFTDWTRPRVVEAALRERADDFRHMADAMPFLAWTCNADGTCDHVNQRWVEQTGVPESAQLGYGWLQQIHADDRDRIREEWRLAMKLSKSFEADARIKGPGGSYRLFHLRSAPTRDAGGAVSRWYGTGADVETARRAEQALACWTRRFEALAADTGEGVVTLGPGFEVQSANAAAERALGRARRDLVGQSMLDIVPAVDLEREMTEARRHAQATTVVAELPGPPAGQRATLRLVPDVEQDGMLIIMGTPA